MTGLRMLAVGLLWVLFAMPAQAEKRVALVIGNGAYTHIGTLTNPGSDADRIARLLGDLGFEVISAIDMRVAETAGHLLAFEKKLRDADVALLFYSGHGIAVAGENYLLPIDARLEDAGTLNIEAIPLSRIQALMERRPRTNILIFDACRNNPFVDAVKRSLGSRSTLVGRGWAQPTHARGTYISFATAPGDVASDGAGTNSPFTAALARHIPRPGEDVRFIMRDVRREVIEETRGDQVPWEQSSLIAGFSFASATRGVTDRMLTVSRTSFKRGETVTMTITPPKDCRLTLLNVDKAGKSCLLFPHPKLDDKVLKAGVPFTFPPKGALRLDQSGEETFVAMCNASDAARLAAIRNVRLIDCSKGAADRAFTDKVFETVTFDLDAPAEAPAHTAPESLLKASVTVTVSE